MQTNKKFQISIFEYNVKYLDLQYMAEDGPYQEPEIAIPTISEELLQRIYRTDFTLDQELMKDEFYQLAWMGHPVAIETIINRIEEFVRFLCIPNEEVSPDVLIPLLRVFRKHRRIVDAVIEKNILYPISITVFARKIPASVLMLCHVTSTTIARDRARFTEHSGFIFQFIQYLGYENVYSFFVGLIANRADNEQIHKWLIKGGFHILLANEIQHYDKDDHSLETMEHIFHTVSVLRQSLTSKVLREVFQVSEVAQALMDGIGKWPNHIETERFLALTALYCEQLRTEYHKLIEPLVSLICKVNDSILLHHTVMIDLLSVMVSNDEDVRDILMESPLHMHLTELAIKFQSHSNFHACFVRYCRRILESPCISWPVGIPVILRLLDVYNDDERRLINETCMSVCNIAKTAAKSDIVLKEEISLQPRIRKFLRNNVDKRLKDIDKGYGGFVPKKARDEYRKRFGLQQ